MIREGRNEKRLKAIRRAQFALKQRLERIDWEEDELLPELNDFKGRAQLPLPPDPNIVDVTYEKDDKGSHSTK
jgi:hypothetical protein